MKFVDTNIFLRCLTWDDPDKGRRCQKFFAKAEAERDALWTTPLVIAEIVWILEKGSYQFSRLKIAEAIITILNTETLMIEHRDELVSAARLYEIKNIDFIDAYNASIMMVQGMDTIYSFDKDFDRFEGIKRIEP